MALRISDLNASVKMVVEERAENWRLRMRRRDTLLSLSSRLVGFSFAPLLASLSPLIVMPVVARVGGVASWASFGVGQSVGTLGAVVVSAGWTSGGPARVISALPDGRELRVYAESFWTKLLLLGIIGPCGFLLSAVIAHGDSAFAGLTCLAMTSTAFAVNWYGVGVGSPRISVMYGTVPRVLFILASVAPMLIFREVLWFPLMQIAGVIVGAVGFHRSKIGALFPPFPSWGSLARSFRWSLPTGSVDLASAATGMAIVPMSAFSGQLGWVASVTSGDKLYRYACQAIDVLGDTMQKWVLGGAQSGLNRRLKICIILHLFMGLCGIVILGWGGRWLSGFLFGRGVESAASVMWWYAIAFLARSLSRPLLRNIVVPRGLTSTLVPVNVVAAILGTGIMLFAGLSVAGPNPLVVAGYSLYELLFALGAIWLSARQRSR